MTLSRSTPLRRKTTLKRSPMRRKSPRRIKRRAGDAAYVAFVRTQGCILCGRQGPSDAAHMPLKAPDSSVVPLCRSCHLWFDGHTSRRATKQQRRELGAKWVLATQSSVTPTMREEAWELQRKGLGTMGMATCGCCWNWTPSWGAAQTGAA